MEVTQTIFDDAHAPKKESTELYHEIQRMHENRESVFEEFIKKPTQLTSLTGIHEHAGLYQSCKESGDMTVFADGETYTFTPWGVVIAEAYLQAKNNDLNAPETLRFINKSMRDIWQAARAVKKNKKNV